MYASVGYQYLFICVLLFGGIGILSVKLSKTYTAWTELQTRNTRMVSELANRTESLNKLRQTIITQATTAPFFSAGEEQAIVASGYIKHGDTIIELVLPPPAEPRPFSLAAPAKAHAWRSWVVPMYILLIGTALSLVYLRRQV